MPNLDNINFNRQYKISFFDLVGTNGFTIQPLKDFIQGVLDFSFEYTITNQNLNTSKFVFRNLSNDTINLFSSNNNRRGFSLDIWYDPISSGKTQLSTIFKGLTFSSNTYISGPDIITEIIGCDLFLNLLYKQISQSFPSGSSYISIINYIIKYYGSMVSLSNDSQQYLNKTYKSPKLFKGNILDIFRTIASDAGLIFNFQNNVFSFTKNRPQLEKRNVTQKINKTNGMIGNIKAESLSIQLLPITFFDETALDKNVSILTVTTLIRPYFLYDTVELKSQQFNGLYGIMSVTHHGEFRQNSWYSTLKLFPAV